MSEDVWDACRAPGEAPERSGAERGAAETDSGTRNAGKSVILAVLRQSFVGRSSGTASVPERARSATRGQALFRTGSQSPIPEWMSWVFLTPEKKDRAEGAARPKAAQCERSEQNPRSGG